DSFTGVTGLERALDILRSGHCRGNLATSPGEKNRIANTEQRALRELAEISTMRGDYHGMEQVEHLGSSRP
ncbi:unnamed protein product, partial [Amoebophrya sp. A120]